MRIRDLSLISTVTPSATFTGWSLNNTTNTSTAGLPAPHPSDRGPRYGNVIITNSCNYDLYVRSVGSWPRSSVQDEIEFILRQGHTHTEPYREICLKPRHHLAMIPPPVCAELDKIEGEGTVFKISKNKVGDGPESIFQLEYSFIQNVERGDDFPRLDYDISLLDCGPRYDISEREVASNLSYTRGKVEGCPGYDGGFALWFDNTTLCRPIYCDGEKYCDAVYNYQRTAEGEDSFACDHEYRGNMYLELCIGHGNR